MRHLQRPRRHNNNNNNNSRSSSSRPRRKCLTVLESATPITSATLRLLSFSRPQPLLLAEVVQAR